MVRPDETRLRRPAGRGGRVSRCISLAGASPVPVGAGAPGSRSQVWRRNPLARAGCRKPAFSRERSCGPQHEVNVAASSDYQPKGDWEGRAAHVTAKATDTALDPEHAVALPGVRTAARNDRMMRNRRGPPRRPTSGKASRISAEREVAACREGVRGGHSTGEGDDKSLEGRAPGLVTSVEQRCARAWP
jgi:hypothetical protein